MYFTSIVESGTSLRFGSQDVHTMKSYLFLGYSRIFHLQESSFQQGANSEENLLVMAPLK